MSKKKKKSIQNKKVKEEKKAETDSKTTPKNKQNPFKNKKGDYLSSKKTYSSNIDKDLKKIYQDEEGNLPKMTGLEIKKRNTILKIFISVIIILSIIFLAAFAGFVFFQPKPNFSGDKINLEIKGPFTALSGENINYTITINNNEDISLTNTQLTLYLPSGFKLIEADPQFETDPEKNQENNYSAIKKLQINDIYPQQKKEIKIQGQLIGETESNQTLSAALNYIPANFSSEFQKNITFSTEIIDSLIELETESSSQIANLEETEIKINLKNKSEDLDLSDIDVELNYPIEFSVSKLKYTNKETDEKTTISYDNDENDQEIPTQTIWNLKKLQANNTAEIIFIGKFDSQESDVFNLTLNIKQKAADEKYITQKQEKFEIQVIKGELLNTLIINGSNNDQTINFNDSLDYLLNIKNKSTTALGDVKVRLVIDSPLIDWDTLVDENNSYKEGNQLLWTKEQISDLSVMLPEEEIDINIKLNLEDFNPDKNYKGEDLKISSFFETQINKIDNTETNVELTSNSIINEINSNLSINAYGRYFDEKNATIGSGPLPPVVNQKTTYKIFWEISNSINEIKNIEFTAAMPEYVKFEDNQNTSAGSVKQDNNKIIWQISRIPNTINTATAEFDISITPDEDDVHKLLTLLSDIKITAEDAVTQGQITVEHKGITTDLENDPQAEGKGLVQEEE